jgi:tetratricopeptide (TPR) repeat protein
MTELRYRAYISYSHKDEAWAAWLHRALESYRVPRNLVGKQTSAGEVPARIRPVFRDRDDLSSATDLGDTVKQALADSENLIVVCSPNAADSHWVREEILHFAWLGRADRTFCIIVGGEPADDGSLSNCFSAAFTEIGFHEPLAADVRKWADGKRVAKLKLIAGLLDIRLDELRQRDLRRRRKRQAFVSLGIVVALILALMTVVSQISERHEREKTEQLATFIVDLGERLQADTDLETLAMISAASSEHLQGLDPDKLSPETGKKVALALRQIGRVSQGQGRPDEALEAFQRSRDLFSRLNNKYPEIPGLLFELGNAEYYIGNLHLEQRRYERALESWQSYHRLTRTLLDADPDNPDWIMELSYSHINLAALQLGSGRGINKATLAHVAEATSLMETVVALRPGDKAVADGYATTLAWAADAEYQACNLENAMTLRVRVRDLAESSTRADPGNNDLKKRYAFAISGVARVQIVTGRLDSAEQNVELSISILQQLSAADPSNVAYREWVLLRRIRLARLVGDSGQLESAISMMKKLESEFGLASEFTDQGGLPPKDYIDFLLAYADVEFQLGNVKSANEHLQAVILLQLNSSEPPAGDIFDTQRLVKARYQWWELNRTNNFERFPMMPEFDQNSASGFRSCTEADSAARMYVIANDKDKAAGEVAYLQARGYADPNFIRFCERHGLCEG